MEGELRDDKITRREFIINSLVGLVFLGIGAGAATSIASYLLPPKREMSSEASKVLVAGVDEIQEGKAKEFKYFSEPALIFKLDDKLHAFKSKCPHLGCLVKWSEQKRIIICPCHDAVFDIIGQVVSGPPNKPLTEIPLLVKDNKIFAGGGI